MKKKLFCIVSLIMICVMFSGCIAIRPTATAVTSSQAVKTPQQTTAVAPQQTTAAAPKQTTAAAPKQTTAAAPLQTAAETTPQAKGSVGITSDTGKWGKNLEGSAVYLDGRTVLISIYVNDKKTSWTGAEISKTRQTLGAAVSYLERSAADYGKRSELIWDSAKDPSLGYKLSYGKNVTDSEKSMDAMDDYSTDWIRKNVPYKEIMKKYGADGVGFLIFLDKSGVSETMTFAEDSDRQYFLEKSYLFNYDPEIPENLETTNTYAHEMLHLFGAVDLYDVFEQDGVTKKVVDYTEKTYPDDIMYLAYSSEVKQFPAPVTGKIDSITAYGLGWLKDIKELKLFPSLKRKHRACFVTDGAASENAAARQLAQPQSAS